MRNLYIIFGDYISNIADMNNHIDPISDYPYYYQYQFNEI